MRRALYGRYHIRPTDQQKRISACSQYSYCRPLGRESGSHFIAIAIFRAHHRRPYVDKQPLISTIIRNNDIFVRRQVAPVCHLAHHGHRQRAVTARHTAIMRDASSLWLVKSPFPRHDITMAANMMNWPMYWLWHFLKRRSGRWFRSMTFDASSMSKISPMTWCEWTAMSWLSHLKASDMKSATFHCAFSLHAAHLIILQQIRLYKRAGIMFLGYCFLIREIAIACCASMSREIYAYRSICDMKPWAHATISVVQAMKMTSFMPHHEHYDKESNEAILSYIWWLHYLLAANAFARNGDNGLQ